ncbi:MAG TPA: tRNA lysidine(34) synthetase TilS [Rhizomicrobium sp.]|nr:tRNA lysidine(34) synthetase TilS [Rhizomicrobium sp.]
MSALGNLWPGAVAVSGGGDSLALMHLIADWAAARKLPAPKILTVDHGLTAGSRNRANEVKARAGKLGLTCDVLVWKGTKPQSDIEAAAREARYRLMGEWCRKNDIHHLYLAHSEDDQAETFLLRLARGSGLDGLSAMSPIARYPIEGYPRLSLVRPLLGTKREDLRRFLKARRIAWHEDPMNADTRFARVRLRAIWPELEKAGLTAGRISAAARHLGRAREALEQETALLIAAATRKEGARLLIDGAALAAAPREVGLRALAELLKKVGGQAYRPRFEQLESLFDSLAGGQFSARTLHGCRLGFAPKRLAAFGSRTLSLEKEAKRLKPS